MNTNHADKSSILIVDDDPMNLDVLFVYLDQAGFNVLVAEDGESGLSWALQDEGSIAFLFIVRKR